MKINKTCYKISDFNYWLLNDILCNNAQFGMCKDKETRKYMNVKMGRRTYRFEDYKVNIFLLILNGNIL